MTNQELLRGILNLMQEHNAKVLELSATVDGHHVAVEVELTRLDKVNPKKKKGTH